MNRSIFMIVFLASLASFARAQIDDMCREFGETPTREMGRDSRLVSFVYGRVSVVGLRADSKPPRVTITYSDSRQPAVRQIVGKSGNYCFPRRGNGGTLLIDVDGLEVMRRAVSDVIQTRQREDIEVYASQTKETAAPGVVSSKFSRPPNEKTNDLYKKAAEAELTQKPEDAIDLVKQIVTVDPDDFIAWAKLGSLYLSKNSLSDAEASFKRSVAIRADYTSARLNLGIIKALQNEYPAAIEIFKLAISTDPTSAHAYRLLGEAYLQNRQGSLGLETLDKAIALDPIGMAECHLLKARLYDLVGAKDRASHEYRVFLEKSPNYPEKKKFEQYIKDNPEK